MWFGTSQVFKRLNVRKSSHLSKRNRIKAVKNSLCLKQFRVCGPRGSETLNVFFDFIAWT